MKKVLFLLFSFTIILGAYAQEADQLSKSELKKLQKEERRIAKEAEEAKIAEQTKNLIQAQDFILLADFMSDESLSRTPVNSLFNFIIVDSTSCFIQMSDEYSLSRSGEGGTTLEGPITSYKAITKGKNKKSWNIKIDYQSPIGKFDITIIVSSAGRAEANIRGEWSGEVYYFGNIVPQSEASIQKKSATY